MKMIQNLNLAKVYNLEIGSDVSIISTGVATSEALKAQEILKTKGIDARVIDIHTIKPLDEELIIKCAKETKKIFTVEDHGIIGGLGSAVCEVLAEKCPAQVIRIGINDSFGMSGKWDELLHYYGIDAEGIVNKIINK